MLQSILTTCIESRAERLLDAAPEGLSRLAHAVLSDVEIFREFGPCDPLWLETKLAEGWAMLDRKPAFPAAPAEPVHLARDARVIVVGDWGTGLPAAQQVARRIAERLEEGRGREQHLIHLGDVYYSGWREEYETRFLPYWPLSRGETDVLCWALNGNHDMYSGGHGYFGFLLHDPRFRGHWVSGSDAQPPASFFSLENDAWQILGLDSAYTDHDLADPQTEWIAEKVRAAPGRRTMLLSHHQPFSAYELPSQAMTGKVQQALGGEHQLDAWIWGHEHRATVYADHLPPYLKLGACVGHGGVPQPMPDPPLGGAPERQPPADASAAAPAAAAPEAAAGYVPKSWALEETETADGNAWLRGGFAVLDFDEANLAIQYVDEHGQVNATVVLDAYGNASINPRVA
jgi:calcineurin-like phosphoesterase family protein